MRRLNQINRSRNESMILTFIDSIKSRKKTQWNKSLRFLRDFILFYFSSPTITTSEELPGSPFANTFRAPSPFVL